MFTLAGPVVETNRELEFKIGEQGFTLILRPVTDDERTRDSALVQRFFNEDNPKLAGDWFIARNELRASCVIDWKGVQDPDGKPVKFTQAAFKLLLGVDGVRDEVIGPINRHFEKRIDAVKLGESPAPPTDSTPGGSVPKNSPKLSDGSPDVLQPGNLQS